MALSPEATLAAVPGQLSAGLGDEMAVLKVSTGVYYGLNSVAAHIWGLLQSPVRVHELVDAVVAEFDVDRERCRRDVEALLQAMLAEELIEIRDAGGS